MLNQTKVILYLASIGWTVWLIFKSVGTDCFSILDFYITIIVLLFSMILNDIIKS